MDLDKLRGRLSTIYSELFDGETGQAQDHDRPLSRLEEIGSGAAQVAENSNRKFLMHSKRLARPDCAFWNLRGH